jgi:hypothetical protein
MALRQNKFQFYAADGTESTSTALAAINTSISKQSDDQATFLIRFLIQADGGTTGTNTAVQFERNINGGAFGSITTTSTIVKAVTTSVFADAAATTARLAGSGTFEASSQGCTHDGTAGGAQMDIVANGNAETVCAVQLVSANITAGDVVGIRISTSPTAITLYDQNATVTITAPPVDVTANTTTGAIAIAGAAPSLILGSTLATTAGAIAVAGAAATLGASATLAPTAGALAIAGFAPTVDVGGGALEERLAPNTILAASNLKDTLNNIPPTRLADIDEETGSDDGEWWTAVNPAAATSTRVGFPTSSGTLVGTQQIKVLVRGTSIPARDVTLELWEAGAKLTSEVTQSVTSGSGQVVILTFQPDELSDPTGAGVEVRIFAAA